MIAVTLSRSLISLRRRWALPLPRLPNDGDERVRRVGLGFETGQVLPAVARPPHRCHALSPPQSAADGEETGQMETGPAALLLADDGGAAFLAEAAVHFPPAPDLRGDLRFVRVDVSAEPLRSAEAQPVDREDGGDLYEVTVVGRGIGLGRGGAPPARVDQLALEAE